MLDAPDITGFAAHGLPSTATSNPTNAVELTAARAQTIKTGFFVGFVASIVN